MSLTDEQIVNVTQAVMECVKTEIEMSLDRFERRAKLDQLLVDIAHRERDEALAILRRMVDTNSTYTAMDEAHALLNRLQPIAEPPR